MFTIYTFGDLHLFADGIRAVSMLFDPLNTNFWVGGGASFGVGKLAVIALMFTLAIVAIKGIAEQSVRVDHILILLILFNVMFVPKTRLQIEDVMGGQVTAVDEVPIVIAAVGGIVSHMSYEIAMTFETVFQLPSGGGSGDWVSGWQGLDLGGGASPGLHSPLRMLLDIRKIQPDQAGIGLMTNISQYARNCTDTGFSRADWMSSPAKMDYLLDNPGTGQTQTYDASASVMSPLIPCAQAAVTIRGQLDAYFSSAGAGLAARFSDQLCQQGETKPGYTGGATSSCESDQHEMAYDQLMPALQTAGISAASFMQDLLFSQLVRSTMHCGEQANEESFRTCVSMMVSANEQTRVQNAAAGSGFAKIMLTAMNLFLFLFYTLTPIISIVMLAAGLAGVGIAGKFLLFGVWAHSWLPVAVVIDFFIEASVRQELHNYSISLLRGSFDGDRFYDIIADHISLGADLLAATPLVTLAVLSGSIFSLTSMASRISGKDHVDETMAAPAAYRNGPIADLSYDKITTPASQANSIASGSGAVAFASQDAVATQTKVSSSAIGEGVKEYSQRQSASLQGRSNVAITSGMESTFGAIERAQNSTRLTGAESTSLDYLQKSGYHILNKAGITQGVDDTVAGSTGAALSVAAGLDAKAQAKALEAASIGIGAKAGWDAKRTAQLTSALKDAAGLTEEGALQSGSDAALRNQEMATRAREAVQTLDSESGKKLSHGARLSQEAVRASDSTSQIADAQRTMRQLGFGQQMGMVDAFVSKLRTDAGYASRMNDPQMGVDRLMLNAATEANAAGANGGAILQAYREDYARQLAFFSKDKHLTSTHPEAASAVSKIQAMANTMTGVVNENGESGFAASAMVNWLKDTQSHFAAPPTDNRVRQGAEGDIARIGSQTPGYDTLQDSAQRLRSEGAQGIATTRQGISSPSQAAYDRRRQQIEGGYGDRAAQVSDEYAATPEVAAAHAKVAEQRAAARNRGDVGMIDSAATVTGGLDKGLGLVTAGSQFVRDAGGEALQWAMGRPTDANEARAAKAANEGLSRAANDPGLSSFLGSDPQAWKYYAAQYADSHKESNWSPNAGVMKQMADTLGPERAAEIAARAQLMSSGDYAPQSARDTARELTSNAGSDIPTGVPPGVSTMTPNDMDRMEGDGGFQPPAPPAPGRGSRARSGAAAEGTRYAGTPLAAFAGSESKRKMMDTVYDAAVEGGVDPALALAVAARESSFNPGAVSPAGAQGLMQLMPGTAAAYGVTDSFDPEQNAAGGVAYLKHLSEKYDGNLDLVLAGYNAGETKVRKHGNQVPPFEETEKYVDIVGESYARIAASFDEQDQRGGTGGGF